MQQLKDELSLILVLASHINELHFDIESIVPLFKSHALMHEIPAWAQIAFLLATQQVSSAAVERVFSFLKNTFKETQEKALSDYVLSVVIQRYNKRK